MTFFSNYEQSIIESPAHDIMILIALANSEGLDNPEQIHNQIICCSQEEYEDSD